MLIVKWLVLNAFRHRSGTFDTRFSFRNNLSGIIFWKIMNLHHVHINILQFMGCQVISLTNILNMLLQVIGEKNPEILYIGSKDVQSMYNICYECWWYKWKILIVSWWLIGLCTMTPLSVIQIFCLLSCILESANSFMIGSCG